MVTTTGGRHSRQRSLLFSNLVGSDSLAKCLQHQGWPLGGVDFKFYLFSTDMRPNQDGVFSIYLPDGRSQWTLSIGYSVWRHMFGTHMKYGEAPQGRSEKWKVAHLPGTRYDSKLHLVKYHTGGGRATDQLIAKHRARRRQSRRRTGDPETRPGPSNPQQYVLPEPGRTFNEII